MRSFSAVRLAVVGVVLATPALAASLAERLNDTYLAPLAAGAKELRAAAKPQMPAGPYQDFRCVLHAHSRLSHDSRGTEEQIVAAAKKAGVRAVFMTEHPTAERRWVTEGLRGVKEGVLFVPGAEISDGLLVWRTDGTRWEPGMKAGEILARLEPEATAFVAHPEQRKEDADWDLPPFTGMEIYNTHADAADSDYEELLASLRGGNALKILALLGTLKRYPQESFAAIFDEQAGVLGRWDRLNAGFLQSGRKVVGIAGNDSHQNVGITVTAEEDRLVVTDALDKVVGTIPKKSVPTFLFGDLSAGTTVLSQKFDPYEVSLGYVNTHLLARELTEESLFEALRAGRAYVSFDWIADPSGFRYTAAAAGRTVEMGGDARVDEKPVLTARAGLPCELRLLRNGEEVRRTEDGTLEHTVEEPGVYRVEAWVSLGTERRPWIYSNPIYVR